MAKNPCISAFMEAAAGYINERQAGDIMRIANELMGTTTHRMGDGKEVILAKVNSFLKKQLTIEAHYARRNAMLNFAKLDTAIRFVERAFAAGVDTHTAVTAYILGNQHFVRGADGAPLEFRAGIAQKQDATTAEYFGALTSALDAAGLTEFYSSSKFSEEIYLEIGHMLTKIDQEAEFNKVPRGTSPDKPVLPNDQAPDAKPKAFHTKRQKEVNEIRDRVKKTGGDVEAAYRQWHNDLYETDPNTGNTKIDKMSFDGVKNVEKELRRRFDALVKEGNEQPKATEAAPPKETPERAPKPNKPQWERRKDSYTATKGVPKEVADKAKQVADILFDLHANMLKRHNLAGGLNDPDGPWTVFRTHSARRILKAARGDKELAYTMWRDEIMPYIDVEKTFDGISDIEKALKEKFNQIIAEKRTVAITSVKLDEAGKEVQSGRGAAFIRRGSLAKRGSRDAFIEFKSPEAAWEYNNKYGSASLNDIVKGDMVYFGNSTALMEAFGPDPDGTFRRLMRHVDEMNVKNGVVATARAKLKPGSELIEPQTAFDQVMGYLDTASTPRGRDIAAVAKWAKLHQTLSKLGYILVSAIVDPVNAHFGLTYNGLSNSEAFLANLRVFTAKTKDEKAFLSAYGVSLDHISNRLASRMSFGGGDIRAGVAHKVESGWFEVLMMHKWNDAFKGSFDLALMHKLGQYIDSDFKDLPKDIQNRFGQYGMGEGDWALLKSAATVGEDGRVYIMPENIRNLSDEAIMSVEKKFLSIGRGADDITSYKNALKTKFSTWLLDQADDGVVTPGARQRIYSRFGAKKGTVAGELIGTLNYFRSFPISVTSKIIARELFGFEGEKGRQFLRMTSIIASTAAMGWVSGAIRDTLNGKTPRTNWIKEDGSPNWELLMDSMARGGGLGMYEYVILHEYDNSYKSMAKTAAGPVFGTAMEGATLLQQTVAGAISSDKKVPAPHNYTKFLRDNAPFINMPVIKLALDYMVFYQLNEMMEPGYLRKMERGLENRTGQEFIFGDPSDIF